jgi:hypothetical protein
MDKNQYLRPMGIGEILDSAVRLYRENFLLLVIAQLPLTFFLLVSNLVNIYFMGTGALSLFGTFIEPTGYPEVAIGPHFLLILMLLPLIEIAILYPLTLSAVTKIASERVLQRPSSVRDAYTFSARNWLKLGITNIIITIAVLIVPLVVVMIPGAVLLAVFAYAFAAGGSMSAIIGVIIVFSVLALIASLIGAFLWIRLAAAYPVMVNEDRFIFDALKRSWDLISGNTLRTFLVMVLMFLIPTIIQVSPYVMELLFRRSLAVLIITFGIVAQGLLIPLVDATRVVVYFELRARKEGLDLEHRVEQLTE